MDSLNICFLLTLTEVDESNFNDEEVQFDCNNKSKETLHVVKILDKERFVFNKTIREGQDGYYNLYFVNKEKVPGKSRVTIPVDFQMTIVQYNKGMNYLPVGKLPLPTLYLLFTLLYIGMLAVWVYFCLLKSGLKVQLIHYLMTGLLVLKTLSLLFRSVKLLPFCFFSPIFLKLLFFAGRLPLP